VGEVVLALGRVALGDDASARVKQVDVEVVIAVAAFQRGVMRLAAIGSDPLVISMGKSRASPA
jgi:hypothetical protein